MSERDPYAASALYGVSLVLAASAIYAISVLMAVPEMVVLELIIYIPGLLVAATIWSWRRWGLIAGILVGGLASLLFISEAGEGLSAPDSFFDFVPTLLALTGGLTLLVASLAGTVQYFRGNAGSGADGVLRVFKAAVAGLGAVAVVSAVLTAIGVDKVSAADAEGAFVVEADGIEWNLQTLEVPAGVPIRILVKNSDPFMHTFTVHDLGIDERLGPWSERVFEIEPLEARIYGFICKIAGHEADMTAAIVVE